MINRTSKSGSETTISQDSITDELKGLRTTDDQIPKPNVRLRANPGGLVVNGLDNMERFLRNLRDI